MSERKVLQKYYPPDFDPSAIGRAKKPKDATVKLATVRLMAPFSMKCITCGEYIYKGRKFNARKETTEDKYYNIPIYRFYIRCTRCSAELTFKTDPKNMDYTCEKGARRNFEPWREAKLAEETEEERLDRIEKEEAEYDAMKELEEKALDAKTEMAIADKLDEIRTRNARMERAGKGQEIAISKVDAEKEAAYKKQDEDDTAAARAAFERASNMMDIELDETIEELPELTEGPVTTHQHGNGSAAEVAADSPAAVNMTFARKKKPKKDFGAALGIKRKPAATSLV